MYPARLGKGAPFPCPGLQDQSRLQSSQPSRTAAGCFQPYRRLRSERITTAKLAKTNHHQRVHIYIFPAFEIADVIDANGLSKEEEPRIHGTAARFRGREIRAERIFAKQMGRCHLNRLTASRRRRRPHFVCACGSPLNENVVSIDQNDKYGNDSLSINWGRSTRLAAKESGRVIVAGVDDSPVGNAGFCHSAIDVRRRQRSPECQGSSDSTVNILCT